MRAAVYVRLGVSTSDGLLTAAAINDAINEASHSLNAEMDWEWLQAVETITTVAGTDLYTPAANWQRTIDLRLSDDRTMPFFSPMKLRERWALMGSGEPAEWAIDVNQILLRPVPAGVTAMRHTYLINDPDLTADSDIPLVPASEHYAIVELATVLTLRRDSSNPRATLAQAAYDAWLARARAKRRRVDRPYKVNVRRGYGL